MTSPGAGPSSDGATPPVHATVRTTIATHIAAIFGNPLATLHVFLPAAILLGCFAREDSAGEHTLLLVFALLAQLPAAERIGFVIEQLAMHIGSVHAGLLSATFGNVSEMAIAIAAVLHNEAGIARDSIMGSILCNMLLLTGLAFFAGGLKFKVQTFNRMLTSTLYTALALNIVGMVLVGMLPARILTAPASGGEITVTDRPSVNISRGIAIVSLLFYVLHCVFSLKTHADLFRAGADPDQPRRIESDTSIADTSMALETAKGGGAEASPSSDGHKGARASADAEAGRKSATRGGDCDLPFDCPEVAKPILDAASTALAKPPPSDEPQLGLWGGVFWMAVLGGEIAALSGCFIVTSIEHAAKASGLSQLFLVGVIIANFNALPEHLVTVRLARADQLDAVVSLAVGSAAQLALVVMPLAILVDACRGVGDMSLRQPEITSYALFAGVIFASISMNSGRSTWLLGATLAIAYVAIACCLFYTPVVANDICVSPCLTITYPNGTVAAVSSDRFHQLADVQPEDTPQGDAGDFIAGGDAAAVGMPGLTTGSNASGAAGAEPPEKDAEHAVPAPFNNVMDEDTDSDGGAAVAKPKDPDGAKEVSAEQETRKEVKLRTWYGKHGQGGDPLGPFSTLLHNEENVPHF